MSGRAITLVSLVALALLALAASTCRRHPPTPSAPPTPTGTTRIVALSPAVASILRTIGSGSLLVGRLGPDLWSDQSLPACGEFGSIDYEALLQARPTDILLQEEARPPPQRLLDMAKANGWHVRVYKLLTLDDIRTVALELLRQFPPPHWFPHSLPARSRAVGAWLADDRGVPHGAP